LPTIFCALYHILGNSDLQMLQNVVLLLDS
jgi:hypothetical protein